MAIDIKTAARMQDLQYSETAIGIKFHSLSSPSIEILEEWLDLKAALRDSMIEGYQTMAAENLRLAEEDMPIALAAEEDSARDKLLDTNVKFLLVLGGVSIVVGIATGIWPVALAGLGPLLLAWLDTNQRRRKRKR